MSVEWVVLAGDAVAAVRERALTCSWLQSAAFVGVFGLWPNPVYARFSLSLSRARVYLFVAVQPVYDQRIVRPLERKSGFVTRCLPPASVVGVCSCASNLFPTHSCVLFGCSQRA